MASILDFTINCLSDYEQKHQKVFFGTQVIQNKQIEQFRATKRKKSLNLNYDSNLVHMKVNFAAILDFFI